MRISLASTPAKRGSQSHCSKPLSRTIICGPSALPGDAETGYKLFVTHSVLHQAGVFLFSISPPRPRRCPGRLALTTYTSAPVLTAQPPADRATASLYRYTLSRTTAPHGTARSRPATGARAEAGCLFLHADASLSRGTGRKPGASF